MAAITNVTVGTTATNILTSAASRLLSGPLHVKNVSNEIVTLTVAGSDTIALHPGEPQHVLPGQLVTGTSLSGNAVVQVYSGIVPTDESASAGGGSVVAGGSIVASGHRGIWSKGQGDFTAVRASDETLTLGTFPTPLGTPDDGDFCLVVVTDSAGVQRAYVPTSNAMTLTGQVLTVTDALFAVGDLDYDVFIWGPPKGYDASVNGDNVTVLNPDKSLGNGSRQTATGLGDGTTNKYWDMRTTGAIFSSFNLQITDTPGVAGANEYKFWTSTDTTGTAQESAAYIDRTLEFTGQASITTADLAIDPTLANIQMGGLDVKFIKAEQVRTGDAANTDGALVYDAGWS